MHSTPEQPAQGELPILDFRFADDRRLNRVPRVTATRPPLLRRLARRLHIYRVKRALMLLRAERSTLQEAMAQDELCRQAFREQYLKSPTLQQRQAEDQQRMREIEAEELALCAELADVEASA